VLAGFTPGGKPLPVTAALPLLVCADEAAGLLWPTCFDLVAVVVFAVAVVVVGVQYPRALNRKDGASEKKNTNEFNNLLQSINSSTQ